MASWDGYLSLAGIEIANEERFRAYVRNVAPWLPIPMREPGEYAGTHFAVGDPSYLTPVEDRAPWVDLDDAVTQDFLGMTILSLEGIENSTRAAGVTQSLGKGGTVGYARDATREIRVTGLLVGLSSEAVQAGFTWLERVLWGARKDRPIVPQLPGVSDLRFFAQAPDIPDQVVNRVLNPGAEGLGESLVGSSDTAYAFRTVFGADWVYKIQARTAADAVAQLVPDQRARAVPGQKWVARATIWRPSTMTGVRYLRLYLRFRDQFGNIIPSVGADDTSVPNGVLYRWVGARFDSKSQMLTPDGMLTNHVVNPSGSGTRKEITVRSGVDTKIDLVADTSLGTKKVYRLTANTTGTASALTRITSAEAGQQWWGRALARTTSAVGGRHYNAYLSFLDKDGQEISRASGNQVNLIPSGTVNTWNGREGRSTSTQVQGDTVRTNYATNPTFSVDSGAVSGQNATVAREHTNVLGPAYCMRVTPNDTRDVVTGLNLYTSVPKGTTVYVTFMIQSLGGGITMRLGGSGFKALSGNAADLVFAASTTPTRVTVPVVMTADPADQNIRIQRDSASNMRTFRVSAIGMIDGPGDFFDGATTNSGPAYSSQQFNLTVGGVAPDGTRSVRLILSRLLQGPIRLDDQFIFTNVMLTQQDAPADTTPDDGTVPPAVLPDYFDGDKHSTYEIIAAKVIQSTDSSKTDAVVTTTAPAGSVTAELAIHRDGDSGAPAEGDIFYANSLFLANYTGRTVPEYTSFTQRDLVSETQRWVQEVRPIAGPTVIQDIDLDCRGAATQVEFTIVAENPTWLRDNDDVIPLPLPTVVDANAKGAGAFTMMEDTTGVVKNYMPQFLANSLEIPNGWTVTNDNGSVSQTVTAAGFKPNSVLPSALRVVPNGTSARSTTKIVSVNSLGPSGGFTDCVVSVWVGQTSPGTGATITADLLNDKVTVASKSTTTSLNVISAAALYDGQQRVDFVFTGVNGAANGFRLTVSTNSGGSTVLVGNPQATLGKKVYPQINAALPDDGKYTFGTDGVGFSKRTPVSSVRSHTIFTNPAAPPKALSMLAGYDEVGLTTYRTFAAIPGEIVPRNAAAVPVVRVDYERFISRWVRFRFYPNPNNLSPEMIGTGSFAYEWVVDQFSGNISGYGSDGYMSIVIDGASRRVWLRAWDGTVIPGDQYVVTSDGSPIGWPEFRDIPWVVSVDYPNFRQSDAAPASESWWRVSMGLLIEE